MNAWKEMGEAESVFGLLGGGRKSSGNGGGKRLREIQKKKFLDFWCFSIPGFFFLPAPFRLFFLEIRALFEKKFSFAKQI